MPRDPTIARIVAIPPERREEAASVLAAAFDRDPLMRHVFDNLGTDFATTLLALFRFSCAVRFELDWPLFGVERAGRLVGVAGVTAPEDVAWPPALAEEYRRFTATAGPGATARFERYAALPDLHRPAAPNYGLGMIGVLPEAQGQGHGRRLLDAVQALSAAHPTSTGVFLDTENPVSKVFYQAAGYGVSGYERLDQVEIWCMFRPDARA